MKFHSFLESGCELGNAILQVLNSHSYAGILLELTYKLTPKLGIAGFAQNDSF
jgi:hypothetical protein